MASPSTIRAVETREQTEMEKLCERLADTARALGSTAERLQARVDGFMQQGQKTDNGGPSPPEPQPGTLGALRHWQGEIEAQTNRLQAISADLAGII